MNFRNDEFDFSEISVTLNLEKIFFGHCDTNDLCLCVYINIFMTIPQYLIQDISVLGWGSVIGLYLA